MRNLVLAAVLSAAGLAAAPALADPGYNGGAGASPGDGPYTQPYFPEEKRRRPRDDYPVEGPNDPYAPPGTSPYPAPWNQGAEPYQPRRWRDWYPGWQHSWYEGRHVLPPHRLVRRVERQGYRHVRTLGFGRRGAIRATAYDVYHRPVMLAVDAYSGQILRVRYL
jgi:hypothetical protein